MITVISSESPNDTDSSSYELSLKSLDIILRGGKVTAGFLYLCPRVPVQLAEYPSRKIWIYPRLNQQTSRDV